MSPRADAVRNRAKILAAASRVFASHGVSASTEQVAAEAGVAIGTVFRHFPTKPDLLRAIMKDLLADLTEELAAPDADLFSFFARLVRESAAKRSVIELLTAAGIDVQVADQVLALRSAVAALLARAQESGQIRAEVRADEVVALLIAACQGAVQADWDADLQNRTLSIIFTGLRNRPKREAGVELSRLDGA
jgi:AcrR family transcriptional regulator